MPPPSTRYRNSACQLAIGAPHVDPGDRDFEFRSNEVVEVEVLGTKAAGNLVGGDELPRIFASPVLAGEWRSQTFASSLDCARPRPELALSTVFGCAAAISAH